MDFQQQIAMEDKIISSTVLKITNFISDESYKNKSIEICGFIGYSSYLKKYVAQIEQNISLDPQNFFSISPAKYLNFKHSYDLIAIFHSHVVGDENPSEFDIKMSENCCTPFMIFSINSKKFYFYEPQNQEYDVKLVAGFKEQIK